LENCARDTLVRHPSSLHGSADSPEEFAIYLNYVRKLTFDETPDYDFLRELFTTAMKNMGSDDDQSYDWMVLNGGKGWEANASAAAAEVSRQPTRTRDNRADRLRAGNQPSPLYVHSLACL
jgi:casein kinase 1